MMVREAPQRPRRLRAPHEDRGRLIEPPLSEVEGLVAGNKALRETCAADYDLQGRRLIDVIRQARADLVRDALAYTQSYRDVDPVAVDRIFLAGHQPELFHPGVWYKNFILGRVANEHGGVGINLLVDSDAAKQTGIRVPAGEHHAPYFAHVPFDAPCSSAPYEERDVRDRAAWSSFPGRVMDHVRPLLQDPFVNAFWPDVLALSQENANLGQCLAQARHRWEGRFGLTTLELPQGRVCDSQAFLWFMAHCLAHLPRLWEIHNASLAEYRRQHRLRSASHPVPDLAAAGVWLEAPFWVWTTDAPHRRPVFARIAGDELEVTDRHQIALRLPLHPEAEADKAVEQLAAARGDGVKFRTRALTTTMWARLALGDLFLHGIGGAKYDMLTDHIFQRFFGFEPPAFLTVSGTLRLPLHRPGVTEDDLRRIDRQLRELRFQPETHLVGRETSAAPAILDNGAARLVKEKQEWIATPPNPQNVHLRYMAFRRINRALQHFVESKRQALTDERESVARGLRAKRVLGSREFAFCLYPEETLREFLLEIRTDSR